MPKKARALTAVGDDDGMAESMDNPVGAESRQVGDEGRGGAFDVEGPSGPGPSPEGAGEMMDQMGMMDDDHEEHADGHEDDMHEIFELGRYVLLQGTNIRKNTKLKSKTKHKVEPGVVLEVVGAKETNDGIQLHVEDGWISAEISPGVPLLKKAPLFDIGTYKLMRAVKCREGIELDSKPMSTIHKGKQIEVTECEKLEDGTIRLHVGMKGKDGWVNAMSKKGVPIMKKLNEAEPGFFKVVKPCSAQASMDPASAAVGDGLAQDALVTCSVVYCMEDGGLRLFCHAIEGVAQTMPGDTGDGWISFKDSEGEAVAEPYQLGSEPELEPDMPKFKMTRKEKRQLRKAVRAAKEKVIHDMFEGKGAYLRTYANRHCTDCLFCIGFGVYWLGMLVLLSYALDNGDLNELLFPKDMDQNTCGIVGKNSGGLDLRRYPRLYYPNPANEKITTCVRFCPGSGTKGLCEGNITRNYYTKTIEQDIECTEYHRSQNQMDKCGKQKVTVEMDRSKQSVVGVMASSYGVGMGPAKYKDEKKCLIKGDCGGRTDSSKGDADVERLPCELLGDCVLRQYAWRHDNYTSFVSNKVLRKNCPVGRKSDAAKNVSVSWTKYKWTPYTWEVLDSSPKFICQPRGVGPTHPEYPPKDIGTAMIKNWISSKGPCWMPVFDSEDVMLRCVPKMLVNFEDPEAFQGSMAGQATIQHFADLKEFWWLIPMCALLALISSFVWIYFLSKFAGTLIWITIWAVEIALPIFGAFCWWRCGFISFETYPEEQQKMLETVDAIDATPEQLWWTGFGSFAGAIGLGVIFCVYKSRVDISIGVIEEASDSFLDMPLCVFFPLVTFIFSIPVATYTGVSTALVLSLRSTDYDTGQYIYTNEVRMMLLYNVFGGVWTIWFFCLMQYITISGAVAEWYFSFTDKHGSRGVGNFSLLWSFFRAVRYHQGTVVLGSGIIAAVMIMKYILMYMIKQIQAQSPENKIIQIAGTILQLFVACVEKFIKFLGKLAFIQTAIYGRCFCISLIQAFRRLLTNMVRFTFVTLFSTFCLLLGKIGVIIFAVWVAMISVEWFRANPDLIDQASNTNFSDFSSESLGRRLGSMSHSKIEGAPEELPMAPFGCAVFAAAMIAWSIMGVYETAIDTIMVCFLEDEQENGEKDRVTFCSGPLEAFMSSTKSLAGAQHEYMDQVRDAKTAQIRNKRQCEEGMKEGMDASRAAKTGKPVKEKKEKKPKKEKKEKKPKKEKKQEISDDKE